MAREPVFYLDANVIIAIVEGNSDLSPAQFEFVSAIDSGRLMAVTSELTLSECLVKPMADRNVDAISAYMNFLDGREGFPVLPISREILIEAARLRSELGGKLPDAIHVATALQAGCGTFLTNDRRIKTTTKLKSVWWDELAATP